MSKRSGRGKNKDAGRRNGQRRRKPVPEQRRPPEDEVSKEDIKSAQESAVAPRDSGLAIFVVEKLYDILMSTKPLPERLVLAVVFMAFVSMPMGAVAFMTYRVTMTGSTAMYIGFGTGAAVLGGAVAASRWRAAKPPSNDAQA